MTGIPKEAKVIIFYFLEYLRLIPNNYSWELLGAKFSRFIFLVSSIFYAIVLVIETWVHCNIALVFMAYQPD